VVCTAEKGFTTRPSGIGRDGRWRSATCPSLNLGDEGAFLLPVVTLSENGHHSQYSVADPY